MATNGTKERKAIIFAADVVAYSKHIEQDQLGTLKSLATCETIIKTLFQKHNARLFNTGGDSFFAEFESEISAVRCAVEFQNALKLHSFAENNMIRLEFRVGVNSGLVVQKSGNLLGDAVNIAARLESLSQPSGISISKDVYEQVKTKSDFQYNDLGFQKVKENYFHAYDIVLEPFQRRDLTRQKKIDWLKRLGRFAAIGICLIIFSSVGSYFYFSQTDFVPADETKFAYELPDKPSIAVMPFDKISGEKKYLADAIIKNLISVIASTPNMFVISENSTSSKNIKGLSVAEVAEKLGVRYIVDGTFKGSDEELEIDINLSDALQGRVLWSQKYQGLLDEVFQIQEKILTEIFKNLQVQLVSKDRGKMSYFSNHEELRDYLRAQSLFVEHDREKSLIAEKLIEDLITKNSNAGPAYTSLAALQWQKAIWGWTDDTKATVMKGREAAGKAYSIMQDSDSILTIANLDIFEGKYDEALINAEQAVILSPSNGMTNAMAGLISSRSGSYEKATQYFSNAMRLEPYYPLWFANELGLAHLALGNYKEVIRLLTPVSKTDTSQKTDIWRAHLHMSVAHFNLDELDLFEENIKKVLSLNPNPAKYANLMKKLQRNKKFGQLYLDAITSFNIQKVD